MSRYPSQTIQRNAGNRLHLAYRVGIVLKGIDGALEVIGGVVLLVISQAMMWHLVIQLTGAELSENPQDFLSSLLVHWKHHLSPSSQQFAGIYLLVHGLIKVGLVAGLLRGVRGSYPAALVLLSAFIGYQVFHLVHIPSIALSVFTAVDIAIVALIWREWRSTRRRVG